MHENCRLRGQKKLTNALGWNEGVYGEPFLEDNKRICSLCDNRIFVFVLEIAIGAPGAGAVYIYNCGSKGIPEKYSQVGIKMLLVYQINVPGEISVQGTFQQI